MRNYFTFRKKKAPNTTKSLNHYKAAKYAHGKLFHNTNLTWVTNFILYLKQYILRCLERKERSTQKRREIHSRKKREIHSGERTFYLIRRNICCKACILVKKPKPSNLHCCHRSYRVSIKPTVSIYETINQSPQPQRDPTAQGIDWFPCKRTGSSGQG